MSILNYLLTCEGVITGENNAYTLVNIFNILRATEFPFKPLKFTVAFSVEVDQKILDKGTANVRIAIAKAGNKKPLVAIAGEARRKQDASDNILRSEIDLAAVSAGLIFPKAGDYQVILSLDDKVIGSKKFTILSEVKEGHNE